MQKVYVTEEQKEKIMEKLNRDVEVPSSLLLCSFPLTWHKKPTGGQQEHSRTHLIQMNGRYQASTELDNYAFI